MPSISDIASNNRKHSYIDKYNRLFGSTQPVVRTGELYSSEGGVSKRTTDGRALRKDGRVLGSITTRNA